MSDAIARFRMRLTALVIGGVICLALISLFLAPEFQWFTWGLGAGLSLTFGMMLRNWLDKERTQAPDQVRRRLTSRRKWTRIAATAIVPVGTLLGVFGLLAPVNVRALMVGLGCGLFAILCLTILPALLRKSQQPVRRFPLEPESTPDNVRVVQQPSVPPHG